MKHLTRLTAAITAVALLWSPATADPKISDRVTITGTVSATPAVGSAEVAIAVNTAPAAERKSYAYGIFGTVIIVTLAPGVAVKRNGDTVAISDLRAEDKVTITLSGRTGTAAPYKYVASKFLANSAATSYTLAVTGVVAVAPPESATMLAVFVKTSSTNKFTPATSLRNTTIQVMLAPNALVTRNGVAATLAGLKLDDRVTISITSRTGTAAPFTYIANRVIATSVNTQQPVTVTGSIAATPVTGAMTVSVYVKNVSNDVGWANEDLKGTTILVSMAPGGTVSRNGEPSSLAALRLDDRITMTLTSRTGTAAPYVYLASRITATPFASLPFTVSGSLVSIPESGTARVIMYVKSVVENDDHNAYANGLKASAIVVTLATGATVTRNGVATTLAGLRFNDTIVVTIVDRAGTAEPYTYSASKVVATGAA